MNKHGDYILHLYNMADLTTPNGYVFCSVIAQRLKKIDSVLYRRWFQLCQFTLDVKEVYGMPALTVTLENQVKRGHTSSLHVMFHNESGIDTIEVK